MMTLIKKQKEEQPRWRCNKTGQDEKKSQESGRILRRALFYFLCFCFMLVSLYMLFFSPYMQVEKIKINGNEEITESELQDYVQNYYHGKYLKSLPKNNYLLVFSGKLEKALMENFKKIRKAVVTKEFPNKLNLEIEERKALLLWCSGEKCYVVDEQGAAYQEADFSSKEIQENHLAKVIDDSGSEMQLGEQVLSAAAVDYYVNLRKVFQQKTGIELGEEFHVAARQAEDITTRTTQGFDVFINLATSLEHTTDTMKLFLDKQYKGQDLNNLAYVDLRVENKIFYKTK